MRTEMTGDGSLTLHSERYGQTFHSLHGAFTESRHVYLHASGVARALEAGSAVRVLEVGFGTGLNCWLTADAALKGRASLEFMSLEQELLPAAVVDSLGFAAHLDHPELLARWLEFRSTLPDPVPPGSHVLQLAPGVHLEVRLGPAEKGGLPLAWADAVYHDAFSPDQNPELWTPGFLRGLVQALKPGGTLVSYSVTGRVRRALQELGMQVERPPGPEGGKRQMLLASKT